VSLPPFDALCPYLFGARWTVERPRTLSQHEFSCSEAPPEALPTDQPLLPSMPSHESAPSHAMLLCSLAPCRQLLLQGSPSRRRRGTLLLSGTFLKRGQSFPWTWRRRAFEVTIDRHHPSRGLRLHYYDESGFCKGGFELHDIYIPYEELPSTSLLSGLVASQPQHCIVFEATATGHGRRQLFAQATSEGEREQWRTKLDSLLDAYPPPDIVRTTAIVAAPAAAPPGTRSPMLTG